jgi:hypothetical protein
MMYRTSASLEVAMTEIKVYREGEEATGEGVGTD